MVPDPLFGHTAREFFARAGLAAVEDDQTSTGSFQFFDEGVVGAGLEAHRRGSGKKIIWKMWKCLENKNYRIFAKK